MGAAAGEWWLNASIQSRSIARASTTFYLGSERVLPRCNVLEVPKAALEAGVIGCGPRMVRVNANSAGPAKTLAAPGARTDQGDPLYATSNLTPCASGSALP